LILSTTSVHEHGLLALKVAETLNVNSSSLQILLTLFHKPATLDAPRTTPSLPLQMLFCKMGMSKKNSLLVIKERKSCKK